MAFAQGTVTANSGGGGMLALKAALVASSGWVISQTSDGTSYSANSDILDSAVKLDSAGAFFVATAATGHQVLFSRRETSQRWDATASAGGLFAGGSAGSPPTAADAGASFTGYQFFPNGAFDADWGVEDAAPWRWWIVMTASSDFLASVGAPSAPLLAFNLGFLQGNWFDTGDAAVFAAAKAMLLGTGGGGGPADTTPPVIGNFNPAPAGAVTRAAVLSLDVTDDSGSLGSVLLWVVLDGDEAVLAYDGAAFQGSLTAGSSRTPIAGGYRFQLAWDAPGWPASSLSLRARAVDPSGNTTTASADYTVSNPVQVPAVSFVPPTGEELAAGDPIAVNVTSDEALRRVVVRVRYPSGLVEEAWDGYALTPLYAAEGSSVQGVPGGLGFTLARLRGWPEPPTPDVLAVSASGREA